MPDSGIMYFRFPNFLPSEISGFARAARVILEIEEAVLQAVAAELAAYSGFLSEATMGRIILRHVPDEDRAARLTRTLLIADAISRTGGNIDRALEHLPGEQVPPDGQDQVLSAADVAKLRKGFQLVGRSYPGRALQTKAEHLAEAVGLRAEAIDLLCDLRPVFDDLRTKVEGVIPLTTLRIVATGVDRIPVSFEVVLSAREVQNLLRKAEVAVQKLNVLGELAEQNNLPVPAINLTETKG